MTGERAVVPRRQGAGTPVASRGVRRLRVTAVLVVGLVASACTGGPETSAPPGNSTSGDAAPRSTPEVSAQPSADETVEPTTSTPPGETPTERAEVPLVVATHLTTPPVDVAPQRLRRLLRDGLQGWRPFRPAPTRMVVAPGLEVPPGADRAASDAAALRAVRRDPATVALLPADAVDPTVNVVQVAGVDPLRSPERYAVTTPGEAPDAVATIAIGGDVMMDRRVGERMAATGDFAEPLRTIAPVFGAADIAMVNLESTLARRGPPTQGIESFAADPRIRRALRTAGVDVVSLANNHSGDFGPASLLRTIELLENGGFAVFGAGANLRQADRPLVLEAGAISVGFVGFNAIGETPAAGPNRPGASSLSMPPRTGPLDTDRLDVLAARVRDLSEQVDVVVVVPHWGRQYTAAAEPAQSRVGRRLLRAGADIVVGGHPHWVQEVERVGSRLIVHSLGNLVFDMTFSPQTQQGVIAELVIWDDQVVGVDFVPYVISATTWAPQPVSPRAGGADILAQMWQASEQPFASVD